MRSVRVWEYSCSLPFFSQRSKNLLRAWVEVNPSPNTLCRILKNAVLLASSSVGRRWNSYPAAPFRWYSRKSTAFCSVYPATVCFTSTAWWSLGLQQTSSAFLPGLLFTVTWLGFALEVPAEALAPACSYSSCSNAASLSMSSFNWTPAVILLKLMAHSGLNFS